MVGNDSWTRELAYTARFFTGAEALSKGLFSNVYESKEKCIEEAYKLAQVIAQKSPVAVNITKKSLNFSRDHTVEEGLAHIAMLNGVML